MTTGLDDFHRRMLELQEYGATREGERIIEWIEKNRSAIEFEPGVVVYRDHFNSESLIAFIKSKKCC